MKLRRTDLASEARELWQEDADQLSALSGVTAEEHTRAGIPVEVVTILDETGAQALGKPVGRYVTLTLEESQKPEQFSVCTQALASEIAPFLSALSSNPSVLVAGLGNRFITSDAIGPEVHRHIFVTRHLRAHMPELFSGMRDVSSLSAEVLGNTGVESGEVIAAVCQRIQPGCVIAVDALASRSMHRLCRTIQITNTGITPGSGVGNHRFSLTQENLGVPVLAIGVPTIVDAATLAADLTHTETPVEAGQTLMVTPKDIDQRVAQLSKLIGYGINLALHPDMTVDELESLLS